MDNRSRIVRGGERESGKSKGVVRFIDSRIDVLAGLLHAVRN